MESASRFNCAERGLELSHPGHDDYRGVEPSREPLKAPENVVSGRPEMDAAVPGRVDAPRGLDLKLVIIVTCGGYGLRACLSLRWQSQWLWL
jgi:hypothetical protein